MPPQVYTRPLDLDAPLLRVDSSQALSVPEVAAWVLGHGVASS